MQGVVHGVAEWFGYGQKPVPKPKYGAKGYAQKVREKRYRD